MGKELTISPIPELVLNGPFCIFVFVGGIRGKDGLNYDYKFFCFSVFFYNNNLFSDSLGCKQNTLSALENKKII